MASINFFITREPVKKLDHKWGDPGSSPFLSMKLLELFRANRSLSAQPISQGSGDIIETPYKLAFALGIKSKLQIQQIDKINLFKKMILETAKSCKYSQPNLLKTVITNKWFRPNVLITLLETLIAIIIEDEQTYVCLFPVHL